MQTQYLNRKYWHRFNELVNSRHMVKRLQMLEIPLDDIGDLFRMCDTDGGGTITVQEFVEGVGPIFAF